MKTTHPMLIAAGLLLSAAVPAFGGPPSQYFETLRREQQFVALKPGEHLVYVCNQCKSIVDQAVPSTAAAMDHCKEGAKVVCPSCKESFRVVFRGPPKTPTVVREVTYINARGEECFFVARVTEKK